VKADFTVTPSHTTIDNPLFTLTNKSSGAVRYAWYVNKGFLNNQKDNSYTVTDTGTYCFKLVATDSLNCADTAIKCADVDPGFRSALFIPSAFSPNGDGANDIFYVRGAGIETLHMAIYNRWGQEVFVSNNVADGWDGTYHGTLQPPEAFAYVVTAKFADGSTVTKRGSVTLLR
jgi:gliding motility-associated-like protein